MDFTIVITFIAITLFLAFVYSSVSQSLKGIERRLVALEERVSDIEDELNRRA